MDLKSQYEAYKASKQFYHIADQETADRLNIPLGSEYTTFPPPETKEGAFERLEMYTGLIHLESYIMAFKSRFPINLRTLKDELKTLTDFIDEAERISTVEAFTFSNNFSENKYQYEYLKWKYDYYKNLQFNSYDFFSADAVFVYGKYFLYKKWIEQQIAELTPVKQYDIVGKHRKNLKAMDEINPKKEITVFERIKRELNVIHWIFISQSLRKAQDVDDLINEDGRICRIINIRSDRRLNEIELYKQHYTDRFENGKENVLVKNELIHIYQTIQVILKLYDESLTYKNPLFKELYEPYRENKLHTAADIAFRTMIILVVDYHPYNILFGYDSESNDYRTVFTIRDYNYVLQNGEVIDFCIEMTNFINMFEIPAIQGQENDDVLTNLKDNLEANIITRAEHPEMFESTGTNAGGSESNTPVENKSQYLDMIQDHLEETHFANDGSYQNLVNALDVYFDLGVFPQPSIQINFRRVNKKKVGWALNNIHREAKPNEALSFEYLKYAKENLSLFNQYSLEEQEFRKSTLYKMFTQKP